MRNRYLLIVSSLNNKCSLQPAMQAAQLQFLICIILFILPISITNSHLSTLVIYHHSCYSAKGYERAEIVFTSVFVVELLVRAYHKIHRPAQQKGCGASNLLASDTTLDSTCIIPQAKKAYMEEEEDMTERQSGQMGFFDQIPKLSFTLCPCRFLFFILLPRT